VIQSGLEVAVPKTEMVNELLTELPVVTIDAKQTLFLQNVPVNINELGDRVKEKLSKAPAQSVYLAADADVNWSTSTRVIEKLTQAGIKNIVIVTQPLEKKK
jgi:biopolymer transport protein ExbD